MARLSLARRKLKVKKLAMAMQWWLNILHLLGLFIQLSYKLFERQCMGGVRSRYQLDLGATRKGAATTEDVLDELTRNEKNEATSNLGMDFVEMEHYTSAASTNIEGTSQKGKRRRRSTDNMDGFREAAMIIGNKIDEATEKFSRAIGVDLHIANKRDKINEELRRLPNLSRAESHKALIAIGRDYEMTALFFTLENDEKEDFVRALLSGGL